ncbi:glycoside hydrolase family 31 protein [Arachidicoccus soli]|uniref:DUF5110 domain-containing protein n=1 Tax=Arachidicoccus soli TaxID=2341117 RepID=A0A386HQ82_9BACT|nr:TIM-barrel domain-containing protein [Arachidicoccus soli]AYD48005.1 DUF5110 domain-containing protein [Arachidicoccus soli]
MKKTVLIVLLAGIGSFVFLQKLGAQSNYKETVNGVKATVNGVHIELEVYDADIIRVIKYPEGLHFIKNSLAVIKRPDRNIPKKVFERGNLIVLETSAFKATLDRSTGKVSFSKLNNDLLFSERDNGAVFRPDKNADLNSYDVKQSFVLDTNEVIYGLGEQQNGRLNQRGQDNLLVQGNGKVSIPFFQSIKGYGIYWDNYSPTRFIDNKAGTSFDSQVGNGIDYYFMKGANGDSVVAQMRFLTGQAPLLPLWVYGYNQSKERYKTQFELLDVVKKYRALHVPLDGIIQDWQYWGTDSNWNAMSFDSIRFPRPKKMIDSVHQLHAHIFIVAWPGFGPKTKQYSEFKKKSMLLNFDTWPPNSGTKVYDVYDPIARDIYWRYLNKGVFSLGSDAWWLDSSEPDHLNEKDSDFNQHTYLGTYRSVRNAFPLEHIKGVYAHQRQTTSKKRVVILTRSAFAGQQRFASNTWSGDVRSSWESFRNQIPAGLNFSLTGLPYWNTDIGGFFANDYVKDGGAKNPAFQELYTRWLQFGTFMPMMRSHGTAIPREIYQFGKKGERIYDVLEKYIKLRYSLLPYLYSTAWQVTNHSGSFMRALAIDFIKDRNVYNIGGEYMFGKSFLVSPVTEKGAKEQQVYLPAGASWYDFWTGALLKGGQSIHRATPIEIMPLYVRAGSIIPWGPEVQYATEKKWDNLELRIYPGADADFTLYEDENDNYDYEKGLYSEIKFHWNDKVHELTIDKKNGHFPGMLQARKFKIVLVKQDHGSGSNLTRNVDKVINYNGKKVQIKL